MTGDPVLDAAIAAAAPLLPMTETDRAAMLAPDALAVWAVAYAAYGWAVFPLKPGGKMPATKHGHKDATTDPATVSAWWASMPTANIGAPTGRDFDVVDIDAPDGFVTWAETDERTRAAGFPFPPPLAISETGSGGRHLFVPPTGAGNGAGLGKGLDYRGLGGYVVLPPSVLAGGGLYRWLTAPKVRS